MNEDKFRSYQGLKEEVERAAREVFTTWLKVFYPGKVACDYDFYCIENDEVTFQHEARYDDVLSFPIDYLWERHLQKRVEAEYSRIQEEVKREKEENIARYEREQEARERKTLINLIEKYGTPDEWEWDKIE